MRVVCLLGVCLAAGTEVASAGPLDLYVGAGVGDSTIQQSYPSIDQHPTGWKVFAGWRPIQMLGAEAEYLDLGSRNTTIPAAEDGVQQHIAASAVAAFAVGYLPQPLPYLDFYGKLGVAELRINATQPFVCPPGAFCPASYLTPPLVSDTTRVRLAYGAGVQLRLGAPALRLEYQGFSTPGGNQSLLSLDVLFSF
jgi:opacity protein-like surface antigen